LTKLRILKKALSKAFNGALAVFFLDAPHRTARANLLPGGDVTVSSTTNGSSPLNAIDGKYGYDCLPYQNCMWHSGQEASSWYMVKLGKEVFI